MKFTAALTSLAFAAISLTTTAVAQTRFCMGGDLDHLSATEKASCSATLQAVRTAAAGMHAPDGWHFVVVCGEDGWKQYTAFSSRDEATLENAAADTDRDGRTTYFRESHLHAPEAHSLQHAVAHEVASILLGTEDEAAIQVQMASMERQSQVQLASLQK